MGERLELTTLGGVVILLDGEPVQGLASRKADALLVYLAVTRRAHAREHLATLLWDDRPLGRSLGNLSVLLNSLKKQLAPFLQIERQNIALDRRSDVRVDLHTLKDALEAVPSKLEARAELEAEALEALERALAVYQGDFLRGFHLRGARGFEEWASVERERTLHLVLVALGDLARTYLRRGDLDPAIRCLQRSLEMDPLQEERHRELMRALALSDRQSEALAQYRRCATVLRAELDVEPSLATRRLHERILVRRDRPLDNLPPIATRTVGRRAELQVIRRRLKDPHTRLLSLVGAGGIGKTRLALEAAARASVSFLEGVWFVDLAPLEDPQHLPQTIGRVLSRPDSPSLATDGGSAADIVGRLLEFLQAKELLLVLDNCEHLLDACAPLCDRLLRHCPGLKVLVTSRERIDLPEEELFQVEPLAIPEAPADAPPDIQTLGENHSIRLFLERARAVRSPFELDARNAEILVGICRSLDGMPLAIELTASRLRSLSLNQISDRLQERKQTVGRDRKGAISRHQTLETAIDWSYNLLNDAEQHLFRLLTIFRGGFDLAALVEVSRSLHLDPGSAEVSLAQLVEKSLVVCRDLEPSQPRYVLLEPVRQFGLQRMQDDPLCERALDAHADYYLRLAERLGPALHGRQRKANIRPLELDADNLRAALRRHLSCNRGQACLRFSHALWEGFWLNQGYFTEGRAWVDRILAISDGNMGFLYGSTRLARGAFAWTLGNLDESLDHIAQALEHGEALGDARLIQWALYWKAAVIFDRSEFSEAERALARGLRLAQEVGETRGAAWHVFYQAQIARVKGQTQRAIRLYQEALAVLDEQDVFGAGWCSIYLGHLATEEGDLDLAREYLGDSLRIYESLDNPRGLGGAERGLGLVELETGNLEQAEAHFRRSLYFFEQLGWVKMASSSMIYLGLIAMLMGRVEEASDLLIESLAYHNREMDWNSVAHLIFEFGLLAVRRGERQTGMELFRAAKAMQQELEIAFPRHLVAAVEGVRRGLELETPDEALRARPWEELVRLMLSHSRDWLATLTGATQNRS